MTTTITMSDLPMSARAVHVSYDSAGGTYEIGDSNTESLSDLVDAYSHRTATTEIRRLTGWGFWSHALHMRDQDGLMVACLFVEA